MAFLPSRVVSPAEVDRSARRGVTGRVLLLCLGLWIGTSVASPAQGPAVTAPAATRGEPVAEQAAAREPADFDARYRLRWTRPVQDKNFFLLSLFQHDPQVRALLRGDNELQRLATERLRALRTTAACMHAACVVAPLRLEAATVQAVAGRLAMLASQPAMRRLIAQDLRPSGIFIRYRSRPDAELLAAVWSDAAAGLNRILAVYGLGESPRHPDIDRATLDPRKPETVDSMKAAIGAMGSAIEPLFFAPTLEFAMRLLQLNGRDEAGLYEPLEEGQNEAALRRVGRIDWGRFPHTFVLVLGAGGPDAKTPINPVAAARADTAAGLFRKGVAPLIVVSGGHVHPMKTPFNEAIEMKSYLMRAHGVPGDRIIVEPHARHTTTNFRNTARLVLRYRIPTSRTALVVSSEGHIAYVTGADFRARCLEELGYLPMTSIRRTSPLEAEFRPAAESLFVDARDPLDP